MSEPLRALIVVRLSRQMDESTSAERQQAECRKVCEQHGWEVAGVAEDLNVSAGATSPFERPELREWIGNGGSDPGRVGEFNVIIFWRLDRIVRSMVQLSDLIKWAQDHDVMMTSATEPHFDMSTHMGRTISLLVGSFAEIELEAIRERTGADQRHRIRTGKYRGSVAPWGYQPVYDEDRGWILEPDPVQVAQVEFVAAQIIAGKSLRALAIELNERGDITPRNRHYQRRGEPLKNHKWAGGRLKQLVTNRALLGQVVVRDEILGVDGKPKRDGKGNKILGEERLVTNDDGTPLIRATPILDRDTFERVCAEVRNRELGPSENIRSSALLVGCIFCGYCGSACYKLNPGNGRQATYRCRSAQDGKKCGPWSLQANMDFVDATVEAIILNMLGDSDKQIRVWDKGEDRSGDIADLKSRLSELVPLVGTGAYRVGSEPYKLLSEQIEKIGNRLEELEAKGIKPAGWNWVPTGEKFGDWWGAATNQEKNQYLKTMQVRVSYKHALERKRLSMPSVHIEFGDIPRMSQEVSSSPSIDAIASLLASAPAGTVTEFIDGEWTIRPKTEAESKQ